MNPKDFKTIGYMHDWDLLIIHLALMASFTSYEKIWAQREESIQITHANYFMGFGAFEKLKAARPASHKLIMWMT